VKLQECQKSLRSHIIRLRRPRKITRKWSRPDGDLVTNQTTESCLSRGASGEGALPPPESAMWRAASMAARASPRYILVFSSLLCYASSVWVLTISCSVWAAEGSCEGAGGVRRGGRMRESVGGAAVESPNVFLCNRCTRG
jgi:hypothetical protein